MKLLAFAASARKDSLNRKLLLEAVEIARRNGAEVDVRDFREFDMPLYDGDLEESEGVPAGAQKLKEAFLRNDGFLIACPEYNHSIPGTLKNAIDWVSRIRPIAFRKKPGVLISASPGLAGGSRALWVLRVPLEMLGAPLSPEMFSLPEADEAFDDSGKLKDPAVAQRLEKVLKNYLEFAGKLVG